jgi:hypothetical protein
MGMNKVFYIQNNIGTAKYVVNFHDGVQKHNDGSDFYAIAIFHNKKKLAKYVKDLKLKGYQEK